jgi:predicted  nucleic acid-binding Zn-ribbon protein
MADKSEDRTPGHAMFGLTDTETRRSAAAEAPPVAPGPQGSPQVVYWQPPPQPASSAAGKVLPILIVLLFIICGVNLYLTMTGQKQINETASKQSDDLNLLTRRMNDGDERYAQLNGKFQVTAEKLKLTQQDLSRARGLASSTQKQLQESSQRLSQAIAQKASAEELNKAQQEANAKMGGLSTDIAGTRKDLADTKAALTGTKGELSGAIARTHDELVELAHRTDRDYFEFNVQGKKGQQKVGTVMIQLVKADAKKNLFSVNLVFDDKSHPRKDHTTNEPLYFYVQGASSALELVVNKLSKGSISGYVSAPKGFFAGVPSVLTSRPG